MIRTRSTLSVAGLAVVAMLLAATGGEAHKPITSPYTYNEHVFPILRDRCGACHVRDGVAPMSLMTHADAVPWGESIRAELMAGHMPPWPLDTNPRRFRNAGGLTARELNILLTWVTGGTPPGEPASAPPAATLTGEWPLGKPDLELALDPVTLAAATQEQTRTFVLAPATADRRWVRAVDILPGTPAMVRSATVTVGGRSAAASVMAPDRVLALWLPGEHPVPVNAGAAFEWPAGAELTVAVRYKKTWEYERKELRDQSRVGIYFADGQPAIVNTLTLDASPPLAAAGPAPATSVPLRSLERDMRAVAIRVDTQLRDVRLKVEAARPDGSIEELIALRPQPDWSRRYWFKDPIALPRGTHINVTTSRDEEADLDPTAAPRPRPTSQPDRTTISVTLDVVE